MRANGSPLSTERLANHDKDKNKEQTPSVDCRDDGKRRRPVVKQLTVCVDATAPRNCPIGRQRGGSEVRSPPRESWPTYKSPSLLFDQDLVVNFATYTRVYMVTPRWIFKKRQPLWLSLHVWGQKVKAATNNVLEPTNRWSHNLESLNLTWALAFEKYMMPLFGLHQFRA